FERSMRAKTGFTSTAESNVKRSSSPAAISSIVTGRSKTGIKYCFSSTTHEAVAIAKKAADIPVRCVNVSAWERTERIALRADGRTAGSRTKLDRRVGRPAKNCDKPPGCGEVTSRIASTKTLQFLSGFEPTRYTWALFD